MFCFLYSRLLGLAVENLVASADIPFLVGPSVKVNLCNGEADFMVLHNHRIPILKDMFEVSTKVACKS